MTAPVFHDLPASGRIGRRGHVFCGLVQLQNCLAFPTWAHVLSLERPRIVIEIGSAQGGLSVLLGRLCRAIGCEFHTFDILPTEYPRELAEAGVTFHCQDVFADGGETVRRLLQQGPAVLLCDGGNKIRELQTFAPMLKPGDLVGAHDFVADAAARRYWENSEITLADTAATVAQEQLERYRPDWFNQAAWLVYRKPTPVASRPLVSALLTNWQRPYNMPKIVKHLRQFPFVDDIVIWDNSGTCPKISDDRTTIVTPPENVLGWGHYAAAAVTKHELQYVQDDDHLLHNWLQVYDEFLQRGDHIVAALKPYKMANESRGPSLLLGWGGFYERSWLAVISAWLRELPGESKLLHREFDRIFTTLHGRVVGMAGEITDLVGPNGKISATDAAALSGQVNHVPDKHRAIEAALKLRKLISSTAATIAD